MLDLSSSSSCSPSWIMTRPPFPASFRDTDDLSRREDLYRLVVLVLDSVLPAIDRGILWRCCHRVWPVQDPVILPWTLLPTCQARSLSVSLCFSVVLCYRGPLRY